MSFHKHPKSSARFDRVRHAIQPPPLLFRSLVLRIQAVKKRAVLEQRACELRVKEA